MFNYPEQAEYNKAIPKNKVYQYANPSARIKKLFVEQIEKIIWSHKLAPRTVNLPVGSGVKEIQIFNIRLKTEDIDENVLRTIDKAITFPVFYELQFEGLNKFMAAYKRPSDSTNSKWVVESYFYLPWQTINNKRQPLPVAVDMGRLYEAMLRQLLPYSAHEGETLKDQVERLTKIQLAQKQAQKLESQIQKEKQFNRKVELHSELKRLQQNIEELRGE